MISIVLVSVAAVGMPTTASADPLNPCDSSNPPSMCVSALGPLRDVTAVWRDYQPALLQPVPISDYYPLDQEDSDPPGGAGVCETETVHQPPSGPQIPPSHKVSGLPPSVPPVPGEHAPFTGPYCALAYIAADFTELCAGCHRVIIDYGAIGTGKYTADSPASDGHWAGNMGVSAGSGVTTPFNGHSPNVKNLCADKFFNDAAGADCTTGIMQFDVYGHSFEGDSTIYHHFPKEGRYFNGPAYLAGDGTAFHPLHWVGGAYFDVDLKGANQVQVWYSAGYRGRGDQTSDQDMSYACACEAPPFGHNTFSASLTLTANHTVSISFTPSTGSPGGAAPGLPRSATAAPIERVTHLLVTIFGLGLAAWLGLLPDPRRWRRRARWSS